jgi:hypothetical protein
MDDKIILEKDKLFRLIKSINEIRNEIPQTDVNLFKRHKLKLIKQVLDNILMYDGLDGLSIKVSNLHKKTNLFKSIEYNIKENDEELF